MRAQIILLTDTFNGGMSIRLGDHQTEGEGWEIPALLIHSGRLPNKKEMELNDCGFESKGN